MSSTSNGKGRDVSVEVEDVEGEMSDESPEGEMSPIEDDDDEMEGDMSTEEGLDSEGKVGSEDEAAVDEGEDDAKDEDAGSEDIDAMEEALNELKDEEMKSADEEDQATQEDSDREVEIIEDGDTKTEDSKANGKIRALVVYPVTEEDLEGPVIKPVLGLASSFTAEFLGPRGKSKEAVLDLRFMDAKKMEKSMTMLSDVKLCGEIQPKMLKSICNVQSDHTAVVSNALKAICEQEKSKEKEEQPVSTFVNNIPLNTQVEMLHFLFPSACSIQLPLNSQGAVQGYAIIEFPSSKEGSTVVKNSRRYPMKINGKTLNIQVIGQESEKAEVKPKKETEGKKKTSRDRERDSHSPQSSSKRQRSNSRSRDSKHSRHDSSDRDARSTSRSDRRHSADRHSSSAEKKERTRGYHVFVGNVPPNTSTNDLKDFLLKEMRRKKICKEDEDPILRMVFTNKGRYMFAVFDCPSKALLVIKRLNSITYNGKQLHIKEGQNPVPLEEERKRLEEAKDRACTVYIGNVPIVSTKDLLEFFDKEFQDRGFCETTEKVVRKIKHKPYRNFQFVVFWKESDAQKCLKEMNNIKFKDHVLKLKPAAGDPEVERSREREWERERQRDRDRHMGDMREPPMRDMRDMGDMRELPMRDMGDMGHMGVGFGGPDLGLSSPAAQLSLIQSMLPQTVITPPLMGNSVFNQGLSGGITPGLARFNPGMAAGLNTGLPTGLSPGLGMQAQGPQFTDVSEDSGEGFDIFVGSVQDAEPSELKEFLKKQLVRRGLCGPRDNPIKRVDFKPKRQYQFVVFNRVSDGLAAVRELNGITFKGRTIQVQVGKKADKRSSFPEPPPVDIPMSPLERGSVGGSRPILDYSDYEQPQGNRMVDPVKVEDKTGEYHVYFGNMPQARPAELLDFIKKEFRRRGLCEKDENPVKRLNFTPGRSYQFAVFGHSLDAQAAIEELNGAVFKGNNLTTKEGQVNKEETRDNGRRPPTLQASAEDISEVYFGNLPETTAEEFTEFLIQKLVLRGVLNPGDNPIKKLNFKRGLPFQFVHFFNEAEAKIAIEALRSVVFKGKVLDVKKSRQAETVSGQRHGNDYKPASSFEVFVGNVPDMTENEFQEFFLGSLVKAGVCRPGDNPLERIKFQERRPYQHVAFRSEEDGRAAIQALQGLPCLNRRLNLEVSTKSVR